MNARRARKHRENAIAVLLITITVLLLGMTVGRMDYEDVNTPAFHNR